MKTSFILTIKNHTMFVAIAKNNEGYQELNTFLSAHLHEEKDREIERMKKKKEKEVRLNAYEAGQLLIKKIRFCMRLRNSAPCIRDARAAVRRMQG